MKREDPAGQNPIILLGEKFLCPFAVTDENGNNKAAPNPNSLAARFNNVTKKPAFNVAMALVGGKLIFIGLLANDLRITAVIGLTLLPSYFLGLLPAVFASRRLKKHRRSSYTVYTEYSGQTTQAAILRDARRMKRITDPYSTRSLKLALSTMALAEIPMLLGPGIGYLGLTVFAVVWAHNLRARKILDGKWGAGAGVHVYQPKPRLA